MTIPTLTYSDSHKQIASLLGGSFVALKVYKNRLVKHKLGANVRVKFYGSYIRQDAKAIKATLVKTFGEQVVDVGITKRHEWSCPSLTAYLKLASTAVKGSEFGVVDRRAIAIADLHQVCSRGPGFIKFEHGSDYMLPKLLNLKTSETILAKAGLIVTPVKNDKGTGYSGYLVAQSSWARSL